MLPLIHVLILYSQRYGLDLKSQKGKREQRGRGLARPLRLSRSEKKWVRLHKMSCYESAYPTFSHSCHSPVQVFQLIPC